MPTLHIEHGFRTQFRPRQIVMTALLTWFAAATLYAIVFEY